MLTRAAIAVLVIVFAVFAAVCWVAGQVIGAFRADHGRGGWYEP